MPDATPPESDTFELTVTSTAFPPNDPRWRPQVEHLLADLKRAGGDLRREVTPVAGTKGGLESIVLALGTSGAITAAVTAFQAWIGRSQDRVVTITRKGKGGKKVTYTVDARNVSDATFLEIFKGASK